MVRGFALRRPPPRIAEVHRAVSEVATGRGGQHRRINRSAESCPVSTAACWRWPTTILTFYRDNFELVLRREAAHTSHNRAMIDQAIGILMSRTGVPGRMGHGAVEVRRSWEG